MILNAVLPLIHNEVGIRHLENCLHSSSSDDLSLAIELHNVLDNQLIDLPHTKFLPRLCESTKRAIALPPASASALAPAAVAALIKMLKFYVKVFKTLYFLNPGMDFVYIWHDYGCWSTILLATIPTPANGLEVKVIELEILC